MGTNKIVNNGSYDNIITKHGPNGELLWAKGYGGGNTEAPSALLVDSEDNVRVQFDEEYKSVLVTVVY